MLDGTFPHIPIRSAPLAVGNSFLERGCESRHQRVAQDVGANPSPPFSRRDWARNGRPGSREQRFRHPRLAGHAPRELGRVLFGGLRTLGTSRSKSPDAVQDGPRICELPWPRSSTTCLSMGPSGEQAATATSVPILDPPRPTSSICPNDHSAHEWAWRTGHAGTTDLLRAQEDRAGSPACRCSSTCGGRRSCSRSLGASTHHRSARAGVLGPAKSYGFMNTALFQCIDVIQGSGVGGGSLHDFNVQLDPPAEVFEHPAWPASPPPRHPWPLLARPHPS